MNDGKISKTIEVLKKCGQSSININKIDYRVTDLIMGLGDKNPDTIKLIEDYESQLDQEFMTQL